jgi:hypothetical protein
MYKLRSKTCICTIIDKVVDSIYIYIYIYIQSSIVDKYLYRTELDHLSSNVSLSNQILFVGTVPGRDVNPLENHSVIQFNSAYNLTTTLSILVYIHVLLLNLCILTFCYQRSYTTNICNICEIWTPLRWP